MAALFVDTLLEGSPTRPQTRVLEWTLSLAALFVVPLYWIDLIEVRPSNWWKPSF